MNGCPECLPEPHQGGYGRCECDCHDQRSQMEAEAMFGRILGAEFEGEEVPDGYIVLRIAVPEWTRVAAWNVAVLPEFMSDEAKAEAITVRFA